jgi:hypothetical protein
VKISQRHPGSKRSTLVAERTGRNPTLRQGAVVQQDCETLGIESVRHVAAAHALLGLGRVGEMRTMASLLHLVHNPVPEPGRLQRDLACGRYGVQEVDVANVFGW